MSPNKLEELRDILLRPDQEKLEELSARIEETERRAIDVAEVLPDSVSASFRKDSRLISALRSPLRQCVSESVREDPEEYADALFPIMGPAIRRSVAEAFKAWIQQANQAIEQSLSPRGMSWRFQAWRAGIPYGQYVLQRTLLYRVEDVYLIHSASGLLVGHVTQGEAVTKDEDAVSAMFTAIQEFVKDSFSREQPQRLTTAELGELTLWAVHGPTTTIVAVIRGIPPTALRTELETVLELIETRHSHALREYSGDRESMAYLEPNLRSCLLVSLRDPVKSQQARRFSPALALLALLAIGLAGWLGYGAWMQGRVARVAEAFDASPGIVVTSLGREGGTIIARGLRDPLAPMPAELAAGAGWTGRLEGEFQPFLSLEPAFVLERARTALAPPDTVTMELTGGTLRLTGRASATWIDTLESAAGRVPGVDRIDQASLVIEETPPVVEAVSPLEKLREILDPPPGTTLVLDGPRLGISGEAPKAWLDSVPGADALPGVETIDASTLVLAEQRAMQGIANETNATAIGFDQGEPSLSPEVRPDVIRLAGGLIEYGTLADVLGRVPRLTLTGHSDESGTTTLNISLEQRRAESLATALRGAGVDGSWITTRSQLATQAPGARTPQVTLHVEAIPGTALASQD